MKQSTIFISFGIVGFVTYFVYRKYQDKQRAIAHPIAIQSDTLLIRPMPVNPALVTDAHIIV